MTDHSVTELKCLITGRTCEEETRISPNQCQCDHCVDYRTYTWLLRNTNSKPTLSLPKKSATARKPKERGKSNKNRKGSSNDKWDNKARNGKVKKGGKGLRNKPKKSKPRSVRNDSFDVLAELKNSA